jgi:hypothetical protein
MMHWPQHIIEELNAADSDDWEAVATVTIWTRDVEHRINAARYQDLDDHIDIKLHADQLAASGLPADLSGCECLVSLEAGQVRDPDPDDKPDEFYHETISNQRSVGQHTIISLPTVQSVLLP